ncbi:MAG: hypothetical protein ONB07_06455 [candidate division KSB1 bacterium]|nr:hypothetical protein [candidate division KSB1 bacterium]
MGLNRLESVRSETRGAMLWARRRVMLAGFIMGFAACLVLTMSAVGVAWRYRFRIVSGLARPYATHLVTQLLHALPDGYVTKNRERVMSVLDAFTNAVSRGRVNGREVGRITEQVMDGLADGRLSYQELDRILAEMERSAVGQNGMGKSVERP